jgi:transcription antitermination factor NusG
LHTPLISINESGSVGSTYVVAEVGNRQWLVVYTLPRHEKQLLRQLEQRSVEAFLPLYESVRRWKSGPSRVSLPLFPSYLFIKVDEGQRRKVVEMASVLQIVGNRQGTVTVSNIEIEQLRQAVATGLAQPHPYLNVGSRVRIIQGPLSGTEGILTRKKGCMKVVVSIELIMQSVAVEVNACDVESCRAHLAAA